MFAHWFCVYALEKALKDMTSNDSPAVQAEVVNLSAQLESAEAELSEKQFDDF